MKKTFCYNFVPSKEEEAACKANNTPFQVKGTLVEIRDLYPPPVIDFQNPWQIKKTLTHYEVVTGKVVVPFSDAFEHVFRHWTLSMTGRVVVRHRLNVILWDVTEQTNPKRYQDGIFFEMLPNDDFVIACMDLFKDRYLKVGDEIGLFWDPRASDFQFKIVHAQGKLI